MSMQKLFFDKLVKPRVDGMSQGIPPRNDGTMSIHDSSLSVWEEGRDFDGMTNDVLSHLVRTLRDLGWAVRGDKNIRKNFPILKRNHRYCRLGHLEAKINLGGRHLELKFFQNIANVENRNGGEYDFDILERMPYLLRLQTINTMSKIAADLHATFGYTLKDIKPRRSDYRPGGVTAMERLERYYAESWHTDKQLGYSSGANCRYNNTGANGETIKHGTTVWFKDLKGRRWMRGTAYYNINNMWWIVTDRWSMTNIGSHAIYTTQPNDLRDCSNNQHHRSRLEKQLLDAIANLDFVRAGELRKKLFGSQPLYRIWNNEKQAWYATANCGYSTDTSRAGLYTFEEAERSAKGDERLTVRKVAA